MDHDDDRIIECATCPATGTTACGDCIVTHLLANDDGPIEYAPTARSEADDGAPSGAAASDRGTGELVDPSPSRSTAPGEQAAIARAMGLFAAAGLLDQPPQIVSPAEFADGSAVPTGVASSSGGTAR